MLRFLLTVSLVAAVASADSCSTLQSFVESACEYPSLSLTSSPNSLAVSKDNCNKEFNKTEWQQQPKVVYSDAKEDETYTIVSIDPDAPTHENGQYFLHWIASNIPGKDLAKGDLSRAKEIEKYKGPGPPQGTGIHRYMFLLFRENKTGQEVSGSSQRFKFELLRWLKSQNSQLCGPIAGTQFRAQF